MAEQKKLEHIENFLVMGKSGAGKQPRIDVLCEHFGLKQLSTGNIFREYLGMANKVNYPGDLCELFNKETSKFATDELFAKKLEPYVKAPLKMEDVILGMKAKCFVNNGLFVPDYITNALFESYWAMTGCKGVVLDGYPRTMDQAKFMVELAKKHNVKLDGILMVDNDDQKIIKRTVGRRICPKCGKVYHVDFKPPKDGKYCSVCPNNVEVILRSDDMEDKIKARLQEFHTKSEPALAYLENDAKLPLYHVTGDLPVFSDEAVKASVLAALHLE
eukprot:TRINITY_DN2369_c0_g3_i1.p1 TRINITY_DN2369_c0_g3~~TRINITY_DN2369_c0_g3_i1.p1  ORF type:complete len:291 (-),score=103.48 TRINITY_DN2369_c0_g3_i1:120-941(-)